jgi:MFS transporter, MHS family, proline/betaine transporter
MRPVGSVLFGIYGDRFGRRLALSAVIFLMAFSTVAIGLLPTYAQAGVLAPILLVVFRLLQGLSAGGEWGGSTSYIVEYAQEGRPVCRPPLRHRGAHQYAAEALR